MCGREGQWSSTAASAVQGANAVMSGVKVSSEGGLGWLSCQDHSAHIWGVISDASCQPQPVPVLVPVLGTLLAVSELKGHVC